MFVHARSPIIEVTRTNARQRKYGLRIVALSDDFTSPTENVFGWQGMGQYLVTTISKNDVHDAVAVAAFGALMTAIGAILADIVVAALDPRVRVAR